VKFLRILSLRFLVPGDIRLVFQNPQYRRYFFGYAATLLGNWIQRTGIGLTAWDLTHSEFFLGLVAFSELIPTLFFGLIGGAIGDRMSTKKLVAISQIMLMMQSLFLVASMYGNFLTPGLIMAVMCFQGTVFSFLQPAAALIPPALVDQQQIPTAIAISTMIFNLSRFLGPLIAIPIIAYIGMEGLFIANGLSLLWYLLCLRGLRLNQESSLAAAGKTNLWQQIMEGAKYSFRHPHISASLLIVLVGTLLARPVIDMFPAFSDKIFHSAHYGFSWLLACMGVGAFLSGFFLSQFAKKYILQIPTLSLTLIGISMAGFVSSSHLWLSCFFSIMLGFSFVMNGIGSLMVIQSHVRGDMRSRAVSMYYLAFRGGLAAGGALLGWLSEMLGLRLIFAITALICGFAGIALLYRKRSNLP